MIAQGFVNRMIQGVFYCTKPECFFGIDVIPILILLFFFSVFVMFIECSVQAHYFNRHPEEKKRFIELTCGLDSHFMHKKLNSFDFQSGGLGVVHFTVFVCKWRVKTGRRMWVSASLPNLHRDQNYLKVSEEFPRLMKIQIFSYYVGIVGLSSAGLAYYLGH
jgi:hypothetical protein